MKFLLRAGLVGTFAIFASSAQALVIASGAANDTPAADGSTPFFNNFASVRGSSGVYLGNHWVLTATHVINSGSSLPTYITTAGTVWLVDQQPSTWVQLGNDISLIHLSDENPTFPDLPTLKIAPSIPSIGSRMYMMGIGGDNTYGTGGPHYYYHDVPQNTYTELPNQQGATHVGYRIGPGHAARWGENIFDHFYDSPTLIGLNATLDDAQFTGVTPLPSEAIAWHGDSGGPAFVNGQLVGVLESGSLSAYYSPSQVPAAISGDISFLGVPCSSSESNHRIDQY